MSNAEESDPTVDAETDSGLPDEASPDEASPDQASPDEASPDDAALPRVGHVVDAAGGFVYDLSEWPRDAIEELEVLISDRGVERVWQGSELVVRSMDGPDVAECIDEMVVAHVPTSSVTGQRVLYEVASWPSGFRASLVESLTVAGIRFVWDANGDLVVGSSDEDDVDAIFESMPDPDELADVADGLEVQQLLTQLYSAVDVLYKNPDSTSSRVSLAEVGDRLEWVPVPFGFEPPEWDDIVARVTSLRASIDGASDGENNASSGDDSDDDGAPGQPHDVEVYDEKSFVRRCRELRARLVDLV